MGEIGGNDKKVRVRPQSCGNVLQGFDTGGASIWTRDLDAIRGNVDNGGRGTHRVSEKNHGEVGASEGRRYMVDTSYEGSAGGVGNSVRNNLHQKNSGDSSTVGGAAGNIRGMYKGGGL